MAYRNPLSLKLVFENTTRNSMMIYPPPPFITIQHVNNLQLYLIPNTSILYLSYKNNFRLNA